MAVKLTINAQEVSASPGTSLFDYAERLGVRVPTSCKKNGKCKECIVEVTEGLNLLSVPTEHERHLKNPFRLSCQCEVAVSEGQVKCHTMRRGQMRIERHALGLPTSGRAMALDPAVTRDGDRIQIDGIEVDRSTGPIHGIGMDLGTTTVVIRLLNLESGELIADTSFENPQRFGGSDVMSRIVYDTEHHGLLMRTIAGYITHAIEELPVNPRSIYEMVVVGNSTMRDIFFRQSVYTIGQSPYRSITEIEMAEGKRQTTALVSTGRRCLLPIHPKARVYGAPIISGHLGADAAACMLAIDLAHEMRHVALMVIGTNTNLIVGNKDRILGASWAAAPAFEGGAIESDANELAQAKGANIAGLQILFHQFGIALEDIDVFYLTGWLGRHLKIEASKRIGLIPNIPDAKIVHVGNAAIEGACIALLSKSKRQELEMLVRKVS